jgi:hypothetical protein
VFVRSRGRVSPNTLKSGPRREFQITKGPTQVGLISQGELGCTWVRSNEPNPRMKLPESIPGYLPVSCSGEYASVVEDSVQKKKCDSNLKFWKQVARGYSAEATGEALSPPPRSVEQCPLVFDRYESLAFGLENGLAEAVEQPRQSP